LKEFFDTSVLVAAFWEGHPRHEACFKLFSRADRKKSACGLHTLAELYATMSALPVREVISPLEALLFVQEVRDRCQLVNLDEAEYWETIETAAIRGNTSGRVYDALLLRCAKKWKATTIYTLNVKHFAAIEPELAARIRTP
jgi:predicted nucleic acid-binding protein